jgi:glycosyltransferase involved in cell wall biosynthesis
VSTVSSLRERSAARHVVVPYGAENASVRARALTWVQRSIVSGTIDDEDVVVHGPGWPRSPVTSGSPVLLLRNVGRLTRGGREAGLLRKGSPAVYDLDDGLPWDNGNLPGLGRWWKRPFPRSLVAERAARASDRVLVGNEVLADWASSRCQDVRVVPTCIEPGDYTRRTEWNVGTRPVIGWIGSPATETYLSDVAEPLAEVHRRTGARLEVVSAAGLPDARLASFAKKVTWSIEAHHRIATWDVGIMPLRNGVYERAKCGYKLLQYAASGVPAVASPVGVNERLLAQMDGLVPTTDSEWVEALCGVLAESAARRADRAARGFIVAADHSYSAWQERWLDAVGWLGVD